MITTKADQLLRSLIDAGLSLTEFTILAIQILRIQRNLKIDNDNRRQRDRLRQQNKLREEQYIEQQLKDEEQRRIQGLNKLREFGYIINDEIPNNSIKTEQFISNEINNFKQKQRDCCLTFNIDYDLRRNQQTLERTCKRAKRNIYEVNRFCF
jgi:paraquat-inducible protein B